jgi:cysteine synthase
MYMVRAARRRGDLRPGATIVESTSGTLGLGLALAGLSYDHPVTLVGDPGLEPLMRRLLVTRGVRLEIVPHPPSSPTGHGDTGTPSMTTTTAANTACSDVRRPGIPTRWTIRASQRSPAGPDADRSWTWPR